MAARTTHPSHGLGQRHVPLGAEAPTAGRQTGGGHTRVASSPDSDLEAFSHNPAHGRADIEGSKSNVAMNAWLPQASYPCDVPPQPNSPPDNVFRPDRPAEAGLGSKKRGIAPLPIHGISKITLKVVVFLFRPRAPTYTTPLNRIPLVRTSSELAVRRPGKAPEGAVPVRPPAGTRRPALAAEAARAVRRQPTGSGLGPPVPSPQSQSFSRGYGSILPTSLAYIVPSTRGCSPWRPDAVMSTTGRGRHSVSGFSRAAGGAPDTRATCGALPAAGPYLRLSLPFTWNLSPLRPSKFSFEYLLLPPRSATDGRSAQAHAKVSAQFGTRNPASVHPASPVLLTKNGPLGALDSVARLNEAAAPSYLFKSDERFARQYRCGPPPEFPLASPRSGIVHHLSGPDRHAHTRTLLRRSRSVGGAPR
ncbi:hypothetical protein L1887_53775 [Cichorium endivia]|nr:hypothetical protein L1887_53775 [Cichorium endivia]